MEGTSNKNSIGWAGLPRAPLATLGLPIQLAQTSGALDTPELHLVVCEKWAYPQTGYLVLGLTGYPQVENFFSWLPFWALQSCMENSEEKWNWWPGLPLDSLAIPRLSIQLK